MLRKKKIQHLDGRQMSLVENALYYANPPDVSHVAHVRRPPLEEYVIKLLHKDLNKLNTEKVKNFVVVIIRSGTAQIFSSVAPSSEEL